MRACAVIPAHNEASRLPDLVQACLAELEAVYVVDDGSSDRTGAAARAAGARVLVLPRRRGKGAALRAGFQEAFRSGHTAAVSLDGDGQHLPAEIPRFLQAHVSGAELVVGDRTADLTSMPAARRWANRRMTEVLRRLSFPELRDSQCGFRLVARTLFDRLRPRTQHFDFESELLILAARAGAAFCHVPVSTVYHTENSKIRWIPDTVRFVRLVAWAVATRRAAASDQGQSSLVRRSPGGG